MATVFVNALDHEFGQIVNVLGRCVACVHDKASVLGRNLSTADARALEACFIDEGTSVSADRTLEHGTRVREVERLFRLAGFHYLLLGFDEFVCVGRSQLEGRFENDLFRILEHGLAVAELAFFEGVILNGTVFFKNLDGDDMLTGFLVVGACVHVKSTAEGCRDAREQVDACKSKRCALASEECQRGASLGNQSIVFKLEIAETLTELDDESVVTFVRSENVRSATDDKIWKILFGCELFCGDEVFEGV